MKTSGALRRLVALVALAVAAPLVLTACANDPLAEQFRSGDNKNYIAGDGTVTEFQNADARRASTEWTSVTESGGILSSADLTSAGKVTVINFWYAGCAPCRAEAKDLQALYKEFEDQGVQMLGVNVRDTAQSGDVMLAYTGIVTPQAVPTTLVLDSEGRVSARILGRFEPGILKALIKTALKETVN
jgi:thiol-disulfide isomerase/thioredoxin